MFKFILPIILIGVSIAGFFIFTNPFYKDISFKRDQVASYNKALDNSKELESERDKLTQKFNSIDPENMSKIKKLLPDNVDNIRLILEIEKIALPYGMVLKDVKYDAIKEDETTSGTTKNATPIAVTPQEPNASASNKDYGVWSLEFSTQGTYSNFINLVKDLENNLRIVDISTIGFSSNSTPGLDPSLPEAYRYNFKIRTYWLKN